MPVRMYYLLTLRKSDPCKVPRVPRYIPHVQYLNNEWAGQFHTYYTIDVDDDAS